MSGTTVVDWARLVQQDRAKAIGIPWSDEERKAIDSGISPDDVRAGILTKEEADASPVGAKKLDRMKLADLIDVAKDMGLDFDENAVTRNDLILEINQHRGEPDKA